VLCPGFFLWEGAGVLWAQTKDLLEQGRALAKDTKSAKFLFTGLIFEMPEQGYRKLPFVAFVHLVRNPFISRFFSALQQKRFV